MSETLIGQLNAKDREIARLRAEVAALHAQWLETGRRAAQLETDLANARAKLAALSLCEPGFLDRVIRERDTAEAALKGASSLLVAVKADEHLPSLRERLNRVDGDEAHRILPQIWPSITAILALSDFAALPSPQGTGQEEPVVGGTEFCQHAQMRVICPTCSPSEPVNASKDGGAG